MNWMASGRHRAMKTTLAKRKQKMRFPVQLQRNRPDRSVPTIPEPPPERRCSDADTPWYILPRKMNEESHDIHALEFGRDRGDKKLEETPKEKTPQQLKPTNTRKQDDASDVDQTTKCCDKAKAQAPSDRRCVFTPVKAKKHGPPERRIQSAIQPRRTFRSESPSSVLMFNEGENLSQAQQQSVNEHRKAPSPRPNTKPSHNIKCLSPESQSRWRGSSCGTTGTKRHSHGFFMDDDDSSSENELLQSFAQESYDQFHKTHKQLSTRSSISSKRAVSMDYDECDKFEREKSPATSLCNNYKARWSSFNDDEDKTELKSINASSAGMIADREQFKFSLRKRGDDFDPRTNASMAKIASATSFVSNSRPIFRIPFSNGPDNQNKAEYVDSESYSSQDSPIAQPPPFEWQKKAFQIRLQQEQYLQRTLNSSPMVSPLSSPSDLLEAAHKEILSLSPLPKGMTMPSPDISGTQSSQSVLSANKIAVSNSIKSSFKTELTFAKTNTVTLASNAMKRSTSESVVLAAQEISPKRLKTQSNSKQWTMASRTKRIVEMINTKSSEDKCGHSSNTTQTKTLSVNEITSVAIYMCTLVECYKINDAYGKQSHG